jgi:glycosyltransferase 2 family protein
VPYRIAALSSFTSYAIGHNIGATAFSGGAIRYRIYSQFRLGIVDVAKICFLTGLTFWLGNLVVLGSGMAYRPDGPSHILQLPPATVRVIGIAALVLLCAYVGWASRRPRALGIKNWTVVLPGGRSTLIQIGIGLADLGCSSLAMYSLMRTVGGEDFSTIAVAFVSATLLGFASHAPGSLGVFDAAMLVALPNIPKEELVAGLLVFRALYFMIPFCFALITMAIWEATLFFRRGRVEARVVEAAEISEQPERTARNR